MPFLWQLPDWPSLTHRPDPLALQLAGLLKARQHLDTRILALGLEQRSTLAAELLSEDTLGTSAIEGESLPPASVRSSVAHRLGLDTGGLPAPDPRSAGLVAILDDATRDPASRLTTERLLGWHRKLFPAEDPRSKRLLVGEWRSTPISVLSGAINAERTHFEAPPPTAMRREMKRFLAWWNGARDLDATLRAGLAHVWFETVHPFEDGNGRIGRALSDMALALAAESPTRTFSLSNQILLERNDYYRALEAAQRGPLDVAPWLTWFTGCATRAVARAETQVDAAIARAILHRLPVAASLNARQIKVLQRLIDAGPEGFQGNLSNSNYRSLTGASKATAARDLSHLVQAGFLIQSTSGGRSTRYTLSPPSAWLL